MFSIVFGLQPSVNGREKWQRWHVVVVLPNRIVVRHVPSETAACAQFLQSNLLLRIDSATCCPPFALASHPCSYGYEATLALVQEQLKPKDYTHLLRDVDALSHCAHAVQGGVY